MHYNLHFAIKLRILIQFVNSFKLSDLIFFLVVFLVRVKIFQEHAKCNYDVFIIIKKIVSNFILKT